VTNRSKAKGTAAESAVVGYLNVNGYPQAERRALAGAADKGDVSGVLGVAIEVKNCAKTELGAWVDEANVEACNAGDALGVVWHKRRGKGSPGEWFVTMDGATFTALLAVAHKAAAR
jgi:hypothetical protein